MQRNTLNINEYQQLQMQRKSGACNAAEYAEYQYILAAANAA